MSAPVKSVEPAERSRQAPARERAAALTPEPAAAQGLIWSAGVLRYAGNLAVQRLLRSGVLQAKLAVSQPGDLYEQEADHVAEHVMSAPAGAVQRKCACGGGAASGGECEECRAGAHAVQRSAAGAAPPAAPAAVGDVLRRGGGSPLDASSRAFMESRFGHDFGAVRVHTDERAAESARALNAHAYTSGSDVVFAAGEYAPGSDEGRRLLAHELTHVVQQVGGGGPDGLIQRQPADPAKQPADPAANPPAGQPPPAPRPGTERTWFRGVELVDDREYMRYELRRLFGRAGLKGADEWALMLNGWKPPTLAVPPPVPMGHLAGTGAFSPRSPLDAKREMDEQAAIERLKPLVNEVYKEVRAEAAKFVEDFENKAKQNLLQVLEAQKTQAKAEGIRYGITSETIEKVRYRVTGEGPREKETTYETRYDMDRGSPAAAGLQAAAKVLLARRQQLEAGARPPRTSDQGEGGDR